MSLEKRLMENMLRFGSKNLTEYDQRILNRMIQEQTTTPTTPTTAAPKAATPAPAATPATDKWGIPGFTAPAIGSANAEFGPKAQSPGTAWIEAYKTYLDNASGWVGKTIVVLKREMLYPDEIVERFVVQSSYAFSGTGQEGQKPVRFWSTRQATCNFDTTGKTLAVIKGDASEGQKDEQGNYLLGDTQKAAGWTILRTADISAQLAWEGSNPSFAWNVYNPSSMNNNKISGGEHLINWDGVVTKAGKVIGYCPVSPYGAIPPKPEGYNTVAPTNSVNIPLQDETWRNSLTEPETTTKKKKA
jgi:hypothetical protein